MSNPPTDHPRDICGYCGSKSNLTDDHIPPKCIYAKPRPDNLIIIAACESCHADTSKDDEYFRMMLCLRAKAEDNYAAKSNWDPIFRSLKRDEAVGMKESFIANLKLVDLVTSTGIFVGKTHVYNVDLTRIKRVVERIVRGLYFVESKYSLRQKAKVVIIDQEDFDHQTIQYQNDFTKKIISPMINIPLTKVGTNVFSYRYSIFDEDPTCSIWMLTFYENIHFVCITTS